MNIFFIFSYDILMKNDKSILNVSENPLFVYFLCPFVI